MDKQTVAYPQTRIVVYNKKKRHIDIHNNMDKHQNHSKHKKLHTKKVHIYSMTPPILNIRTGKTNL